MPYGMRQSVFGHTHILFYFHFYRTQVSWGSIYVSQSLSVCLSVSKRHCANLTDVTLADQATNSIQADNANMAIQGNVAMNVTQSSGQLLNQYRRRHPLTMNQFPTNQKM